MLRLTAPDTRGPEARGRVATVAPTVAPRVAHGEQGRQRGLWIGASLIRVAILCAIVFFTALSPLAAAESARVRVGAHEPPGKDPFGRIVFEWTAPVGYKAAIESGRLVVRFEQPFEGKLDLVRRYLGDYVSGSVIEDGGHTVAFPLTADFRLKTYADGPTIVLDLTRTASTVSNTPKPPEKTAAASAMPNPATAKPKAAPAPTSVPTLTVRTGDHSGFGRLVFDWTRNVDYTVDKDGNRVTVHFDQPARLDFAALGGRLPKSILSIEPAGAEGGLGVTLRIPDNARLRHFRSGTGVVIDVLDPVAPAAQAAAAASPKPSNSPNSSNSSAAGHSEAKSAPRPSPKPASSAPANLLNRQPVAPSPAASAKTADTHASQTLDQILATIPALKAAQSKPAAVPKAVARSTPAPPSAPSSSDAVRATPSIADSGPLHLVVRPLGTVNQLTGLRFSWPQDVGAAIYERSGLLWLIFDHRATMEIAGAWPRIAVKPRMVDNAAVADVTVVRWPIPQGLYPALRHDGKDWLVDLKTSAWRPSADLKPEAQVAAAQGSKLLVRGSMFGAVRQWRDPEVGDLLWIAPMTSYGWGSAGERRLADVQFLATLQGLVVKSFNDDVVVRNVAEGIEVTMPGGLNLSSNSVALAKSSGRTPISALAVRSSKLFDFDAWRTPQDTNFFDRRRELQRAVIDASEATRNAERLALAQFFFAHGLAADALGVLQVIESDDENALKDPAFHALRGASYYLLDDYTAAGSDLFNSALDTEREAALWRGALLASQNDWFAASRYFNQAGRVLPSYPMDLQLRFGLLAAESALMIGDTGLAKFQLDDLARLKPDRAWQDQIDYLQGSVLAKMNDLDGAIAAWDRAMSGVHRLSKVKARLARTDALLAAKRMTPKQAIDELEKLRYAWRGDDTELKVLTHLGKLYLDVGDYRNGFTTLREAVTYFPQSPQLPAIKDTMRLAFASLYLNGGADKMPTLAALSLYDDFRDLAPTGEAGDVVTSKLVNRLVQVELLDRAADLLKQQIDKRLKGAPLADAVNQLAVIHLLARQPEQALAVLSRPITPDATPTAASQRRLITARTLGELARYREALNLLENDTSVDADRLRAEIGWRTQNWPLAAASFGKLVPAAGRTMTDADRQTVLRLAIAQSLSENAAGLKELRKTYGKAMAESAYKESFNLVTAPPGDGPAVDLRAITRQVAEVDQFRAFITSYRDKLLTRKDAPVKPASALPAKADQQTAAAAN